MRLVKRVRRAVRLAVGAEIAIACRAANETRSPRTLRRKEIAMTQMQSKAGNHTPEEGYTVDVVFEPFLREPTLQ